MIISDDDYLAHFGTLHKSGRYPWGSGDTPQQQNKMFLDYVNDLKKQGMSDAQIAKGLGVDDSGNPVMSSTKLRALKSIALAEQRQANITKVQRLKAAGVSNTAIGLEMGVNESVVRSWLAPGEKEKADNLQNIATMLKTEVAEKQFVDVGAYVENHLQVTRTKLATAVAILQDEGYAVHPVKIPQQGTGKDTELKVLCPPGTTQKEVWQNKDKIQQIRVYSDDGGNSFVGIKPPLSIHPDRVAVRYAEDGGTSADGVIYVRRGVKDVELGKSTYAQVRVAVGDGHYLKGMAMYKDGLPDGADLVFNTNKSKHEFPNKLDAMKKMERDPQNPDKIDTLNPFGTFVRRQILDETKSHPTSAMNIVNEEGDWLNWSKSIASQVLSKQRPALVKQQLDMTFERRKQEFADIMSMTNPTVRKKLLKDFSGSVDSAAVHLKAAHLPRQGWHAILPIDSIKPTEIYAPNFKPGEVVALIRYPHGGTFEIPELVVNNKHPEAKKLLGEARDAVGIHSSVAERLSGADFDGDTVLIIPNNSKKIKSTPALEGLKGFNPRVTYKGYPGMKVMKNTQKEMGEISNLITDMTIRNASTAHLARAIRHSMVVIDAEKHELNHRQSYLDNGIKALKEEYQRDPITGSAGAATLISRAKSKVFVEDRKDRLAGQGGRINPVTGERQFQPTNRKNYKTGAPKLMKTTKLAEATDAHTLSSGTPVERLYADHSNRLKAMANQARLAELNTPPIKYKPSAKKVYAKEVQSLNSQLSLAQRNAPLERQAQLIAGTLIKARRDANPNMDDATLKKIKFISLEEGRTRMNAKKIKIDITPSEWAAIQAGAISNDKLTKILDHADMDVVRAHALPKIDRKMTSAKTIRAQQMLADGYSRAEVAEHLGVSTTTLDLATHEGNA